jgi:hypothetical protein
VAKGSEAARQSGQHGRTQRGRAGEFNSSVTRVWPVFDWLFRSDPTGRAWLTKLLHLGSRAQEVEPHILSDPGPICARLARFERPLPGPGDGVADHCA